jgi:hypothetical protein
MGRRPRPFVALALVAVIGLITYAAFEIGPATASHSGTTTSTGAGGNTNAADHEGVASRSSPGSLARQGSSAPGTLPSRRSWRSTGSWAPGTLPSGGSSRSRPPSAPGALRSNVPGVTAPAPLRVSQGGSSGLAGVPAEPLTAHPLEHNGTT